MVHKGFKWMSGLLGKRRMLKALSIYPPWLGTGIRINEVSPDLRRVEVEMRRTPWNLNYVGTHFGGSLYSMCDPFFMIILIEHLGPAYAVWDKAATIRFLKPGRGTVRAVFEISQERIEQVRLRADAEGRIEETFSTEVLGEGGEVVARVEKLIHVNKRRPRQGAGTSR